MVESPEPFFFRDCRVFGITPNHFSRKGAEAAGLEAREDSLNDYGAPRQPRTSPEQWCNATGGNCVVGFLSAELTSLARRARPKLRSHRRAQSGAACSPSQQALPCPP